MAPTNKTAAAKEQQKKERAYTRKEIRRRKKAIKDFSIPHLEAMHPEIELTGVFVDEFDGEKRIVIVAHENSDMNKLDELAKAHFKQEEYILMFHDDEAESTSGECVSGTGIMREGTETFGTVGGYFRMSKDEAGTPVSQSLFFGLSNNHVIGLAGQGVRGDWITDINRKRIGRLFKTVPLKKEGWNGMDAALFLVEEGLTTSWNPASPTGKVGARINMNVYKIGAKTGLTSGVVRGIGHLKANLEGVDYWFEDVISIEGTDMEFSDAGDSGSMVLTDNHVMVGVLFYKVGKFGYACPVKNLAGLNLTL